MTHEVKRPGPHRHACAEAPAGFHRVVVMREMSTRACDRKTWRAASSSTAPPAAGSDAERDRAIVPAAARVARAHDPARDWASAEVETSDRGSARRPRADHLPTAWPLPEQPRCVLFDSSVTRWSSRMSGQPLLEIMDRVLEASAIQRVRRHVSIQLQCALDPRTRRLVSVPLQQELNSLGLAALFSGICHNTSPAVLMLKPARPDVFMLHLHSSRPLPSA